MIDVRDYLDRMAHEHGYEEYEPDPDCDSCIHCVDGKCNAQFCDYEKRYTAEDYVPKYVHYGDYGRLDGDKLWSQYEVDHFVNDDWDPTWFCLEKDYVKEEWE